MRQWVVTVLVVVQVLVLAGIVECSLQLAGEAAFRNSMRAAGHLMLAPGRAIATHFRISGTTTTV